MQRTSQSQLPLHVGVIMDGNGRWAIQRGLTRSAGHRQGAEAVRRTVQAAADLGIGTLTLFAFSADNWQRPASEVNALMYLFERFLTKERAEMVEKGVRLNVIGRRDRLQPSIVRSIEEAERATRGGSAILVRLAVDYSARRAISDAARLPERDGADPVKDLNRRLEIATHSVFDVPALDLVIRTSGEQRLSDFLLWESAYSELRFVPDLWPNFGREQLAEALSDFRSRSRRFGRIPAVAS